MGSRSSKVAKTSRNAAETSSFNSGEAKVNNNNGSRSLSSGTMAKNEACDVESEVKSKAVFVTKSAFVPRPRATREVVVAVEEMVTVSEVEIREAEVEESEIDPHAWRKEERLHVPSPSSAMLKPTKSSLKLFDYGYFTHVPAAVIESANSKGGVKVASLREELKTQVVVADTAVVVVAGSKSLTWDPTLRLDPHESTEDELPPSTIKMVEDIPLPKPITTEDLPPHLLAVLQPLLPENPSQPLYTHALIHAYALNRFTHPLTSMERFEFLVLLSPSYPLLILCTECHILHAPLSHYFHPYKASSPLPITYKVHPAYLRDQDLARSTCPNELRIGRYLVCPKQTRMLPLFPFLFSPAQAQIAVKRNGMGLDASLSVRSLNWLRVFQREAWVHLWGCKSKVADGKLLVRTQHWFMLPEQIDEDYVEADDTFAKLLRNSDKHQLMDHCQMLCKHQGDLGKVEQMLFVKKSMFRGGKSKRRTQVTAVFGCTECPSEFEVRMGLVNGRDVLVMSAWRDLGRCESLEDGRFRSHFWEFDAERVKARHSEKLNWKWRQADNANEGKKEGERDGRVEYPKEMELLESLAARETKEEDGEKVWRMGGEGVDFVPGSIKSAFGDESNFETWVEELERDGWLRHLETSHEGYCGERALKK